jgi:hypothetical protein
MLRRPVTVIAALAALLSGTTAAAAQQDAALPQGDSTRKPRAESPLWQDRTPLELTLTTNLRRLRADKTPGADHPYRSARLMVSGTDGKAHDLDAEVRTRGKWRLRECDNPPIRIRLARGEAGGTPFSNARRTRVVMPCRNSGDYEQYVLLEYAAYRIFETLTPLSYRARLAKLTLADSASGRPERVRWAILLEDDEDAAERFGAEPLEITDMQFKDLDPDQTLLVSMFQYMIGNPDWIVDRLHNVTFVRIGWVAHPIAYDFDWTGFVSPQYGSPDPKLQISNLRQRIFLGPCLTDAQLSATAAKFLAAEPEIMKVIEDVPDLSGRSRSNASRYLAEFFAQARDERKLKREIDRRCVKQ